VQAAIPQRYQQLAHHGHGMLQTGSKNNNTHNNLPNI
jgi:hypothetical protein